MSLSSKRRFVWNKSHRKEKDPDLIRVSTRSPGIDGMPAKIPASEAGAAAGGGLCGGRGGCGREEEDGREEGADAPLEALRTLLLRLLCVGCSDGCPHHRKRLTLVGQNAVGWQHARHGTQNALLKALY